MATVFGKKLATLRKEKDWTQGDIAKKISMSPRHISKYERGEVLPNAEALIKIAEILNVSVDSLLFDRESKIVIEDDDLKVALAAVSQMKDEDKNVIKALIRAYVKKVQFEALVNQ